MRVGWASGACLGSGDIQVGWSHDSGMWMGSHVLLLLFALEVGDNGRAGSLCTCPRLVQVFGMET